MMTHVVDGPVTTAVLLQHTAEAAGRPAAVPG